MLHATAHSGESHGKGCVVLVEGMPAGVPLDLDMINAELRRRQGGYGRSGRMKIERDVIDILSGLRQGVALGSPVAMRLVNKDYRRRLDDSLS